MRVNEYNNLDEFIIEYKDRKYPMYRDEIERYMGIEFIYDNQFYRMCREPHCEEGKGPLLPNGKIGLYDVFEVKTINGRPDSDAPYKLIGWYSDLFDVLENCYIKGRKFKDVIMDDDTIIYGKD